MPKEDYRLSVYLGSGKDGRHLRYRLDQACQEDRFRHSPMNFVRYAIRFTLEHDTTLKSEMPTVEEIK
jgi:hypothetical protein